MSDSDGGPAFPCVHDSHFQRGMSLRDYATIEFTKAWIGALAPHYLDDVTADEVSNDAHVFGRIQSDMFIAARTKEGGEG